MQLLYTLGIYLYAFVIRIAAAFRPKAKKWVSGRKDLFEHLRANLKGQQQVIWFHCASLGEFEQGRPLLEQLRQSWPEFRILLTFYSPSGYEIRKNYAGADWVFYMPLDTPSNAKHFLDIVKPAAVFIVKYEFWYNFLTELANREIPTYLVSGVFRKNQLFFKWYGTWFRKRLQVYTRFYVQDQESALLLAQYGFSNTLVSGDTRFDRVRQIAAEARDIPLVEMFGRGSRLLIAGSAWAADLDLISQSALLEKGYKLVIAPHEIETEFIREAEAFFSRTKTVICFSAATELNITAANVLIIDNVGMLSALYRYGSLAWIGGGFGDGIHNILEAAVFGLPVMFGPNHEKFPEALALIRNGAAFCIQSPDALNALLEKMDNASFRAGSASSAAAYVAENAGATQKIIGEIHIGKRKA
jgi:3-deoxy-D-manno-octulosonic-acid transferase